MRWDFALFDGINGLAGHVAWLDTVGALCAVYGALGVIVLALAVLWWSDRSRVSQGTCLRTLLMATLNVAILLALEWFVSTHLLHHDLRARPANARWTTLLITEQSHLAFPAWPVVFSFALSTPLLMFHRQIGWAAWLLASLLGFSLVFVGVNYPLDVITGMVLGMACGFTATTLCTKAPLIRLLALIWAGVALWGGVLATTMKPAYSVHDTEATSRATAKVMIPPPTAVLTAMKRHVPAGADINVRGATNRHIQVASVQVVLPNPDVTREATAQIACAATNDIFRHWPTIDMVTVEVAADFQQGLRRQVGTLYSATISRDQWPQDGIRAGRPLPGKKYYHPRFYVKASGWQEKKQFPTNRP